MLQAAIGRVNARAGEERRMVPERDEKTLMLVDGLIVEVTLRPLSACSTTDDPIQISRADVLNLTSAEARHNHPKLYKAASRARAASSKRHTYRRDLESHRAAR